MVKALICTIVVALAGACASPSPPSASAAPNACDVSAADRGWIERSLIAWRASAREIAGLRAPRRFDAVFFDAQCTLTSANALTNAEINRVTWRATPHQDTVTLPDGESMPAGVTSFTRSEGDTTYFVMSTPSVWRDNNVPAGPLGLETLMVAVLLHEGSHVAQAPTYGPAIGALAERHELPDSFNDDSVQERFGTNPEFAASVARETDLFFQAAAAPDIENARARAREARALMRARAARWFTGADAYFTEAEDLWLTFEGSGQFVGYRWLVAADGAGATRDEAMGGFGRRSRWWSQNLGLAIALTLDRLDPAWTGHAFGDGAKTILQILDEALAHSS